MFGSDEFDAPIFKILANNDTGAARGHQGGLVVPAALDPYFPRLSGEPSPATPTLEADVTLELWVGNICIGIVPSRYQYQTWGGDRPPERRLTRGFSDWRNEAQGGDVAVFQRSTTDESYYRLFLFKRDQLPQELADAIEREAPQRWGLVRADWQPVRNDEIDAEEDILLESEPQGLGVFVERERVESASVRARRSHAFRSAVMRAYSGICAVTGQAIFAPSGNSSNDAAHIVPVEASGADIVQNGNSLRKDLHWAFDRGLWSISLDHRVVVAPAIDVRTNPVLAEIAGATVNEPIDLRWKLADEAIQWHRENRLLR